MLLTAPLLSKSSFLGSLLNKVRQVIKIEPIKPIRNDKLNNNNLTSTPPLTATPTVTATLAPKPIRNTSAAPTANADDDHLKNRPAPVANISISSPAAVPAAKTLEEKVGLPPRPKKPLTPYFRFMKELRPKMQAENPKVSNIDLVRLISKQWETTTPTVKQRLQEEYKQDHQQYVERRTKYDAKISDEQRAEIKQLKQDIVESKERKMLRKRIQELGRPKKPASAFLRFISKERTATPQTAKQTYREWHQKATAKWTRLSDAEKEVYLRESRVELDKYKKEITAWEEKMIRLGHIDVVRHGNLIDPPEPKPRKH